MERRHEVLFTQLETYRGELLACVADVSGERAETVPPGFRNNVRWHLGHVFLDQYLWLQALTRERQPVPEGFQDWFGFGTDPSSFTPATPGVAELKELLAGQVPDIRARYGERLEEGFPPTEMGMTTVEQVLVRTVFHEGIHLANVVDILRFV